MNTNRVALIPVNLGTRCSNTSRNKFPVWHIVGTTVFKSIWFLDNTNFQMLSVEISWQSDVYFRSYRGFGEATFVQTKQWSDKRYEDSSPGKSTIIDWYAKFNLCPKRPKTQKWAGKVMAFVFWDAHGILFIDYLEKGKTINSDYYMALLDWLSAEIKKKRSHMQKKKVPILRAKTNHSTKKASKSWGSVEMNVLRVCVLK